MIKGVPAISSYIGISRLACYVLLQLGHIRGKKVSLGKRTAWHVTPEDADETREVR